MRALKILSFKTRLFLVLAALLTLICGLIFAAAQQIYRQSANDPQIQLSEDMADYLSSGKDPNLIIPKTEVDITRSLVWFVINYNESAQIVASNAKLDGQTPVLPSGVLEHTRQNGQNKVTWEPKDGVRIAAVITKYNGGSVLVGRSLRETEKRIQMLGKRVLVAWLVTIAAAFAGIWFLLPELKKSR